MSEGPLFWTVFEVDGKRRFFIVRAGGLVIARLKAAVAGLDVPSFVEGHEVDEASAKNVPKDMLGKVLSEADVRALYKRLNAKGPPPHKGRR